jgi:hypothetical protein
MNTKYIITLLLVTSITFAQIGIGTTTPNDSAILDVTSSNKGFLQPRVALTGTADAATIASPATGLMVFNTATAGSGATAVTPGVYYHNGTAWQRVANQADVTAASTPTSATFVNGSLGTALNGQSGDFYDPFSPSLSAKSSNATISLPPGKWAVNLEITADISTNTEVQPAIVWMNYWLDENTPTNVLDYTEIIDGTSIGTGDALFTGAASFVRPVGSVASNHSGTFYINNTSQANKIYTLYFFESLPYNQCNNFDCIVISYNKFGGTNGWPGNRFYATKIN